MPAKRTLEHCTDDARKAAKTSREQGSASQQHATAHSHAPHSQAPISRFGACALTDRSHGAGQIKSVHVTNFMCHTNMKVDFEPHVNFISGPNGSGKSAILQALQYCLGVRATQTGRGTSNAAYLKRGEDTCTAQVTIWNTGLDGDAFHPEIFGPHITIHKTLSAKGHTSTKVLDARGHKTQLTKADDIRRLLSHLSVNAANPSIVLTQDHARGLLSGDKVDTKLYDLMFESLEFQRTLENLSSAREEILNQSEEVDKFKQAKEEYEQKLEDLENRLFCAKQAETLRDVGDQVQDYMAWAIVKFLSGRLKELEDEMRDCGPAARQQFEEQMAAADEEMKQLGEQEQEVVAVIAETERRTEAHTRERDTMRKKRRDAMSKKNKVSKLLEIRKAQLAEAESKKLQADASIQELRARGDGTDAIAKQLQLWHERKDAMVQSMDESQGAQRDATKAYKAAMENVGTVKDKADALRLERSNQKSAIEAIEKRLQSMERSSGPNQQAALFDPNAVALLHAIERNSREFKYRPVGPIGAHLSLMDDRFSATVVGAMGKLLSAWVVDNRNDFKVLLRLAKQAGLRTEPSVYIMRFDVPLYNISPQQMPHESILTIFRVLKVKQDTPNNHVVLNLLVDHGRIENLGLAESEASGRQLLEDGQAWRNLSNVWCNSGDGPVDMKRTAGGARSIWPWPNYKRLPERLLTADTSSIIESMKHALAVEKEKMAQIAQTISNGNLQLTQANEEANAAKLSVEKHNAELRSWQQQLSRLDSEKPEVQQSADDEIAEQLSKSDEAGDEIRRLKPEIEEHAEEMTRAEQALQEVEDEKRIYDANALQMREEISGKLNFQMQVSQKLAQVAAKRDVIIKNLAKIDENERAANAAKAELMPAYEKALEGAESVCTAEEAEAELPALKKAVMEHLGDMLQKRKDFDIDKAFTEKDQLEQLSSRLYRRADKYQDSANGEAEALEVEVDTVKTTMQANLHQTTQILDLVSIQRQSFKARKQKYVEIRDQSCNAISSGFRSKLKTGRNWKGHVHVDHDSCTVVLSVTPNKGVSTGSKKDAAVKDMKALSGGERSFTSVSFMLSLGSEIRTPFFAMDEFDVFMDAVNRKVSLTSILKFAWEMQDKQFILLSPLDMAVVEQSRHDVNESLRAMANGAKFESMPKDFIRSYQMQPPREGARAHF